MDQYVDGCEIHIEIQITNRMVETRTKSWDVYHLSTGAGFRNHPQYHVRCSADMNGFILWKIPYGDLLLGKLANYINVGFSSKPRLITITG